MAELETGNPDELTKRLRNWLKEAQDPMGALREGTDPVEWAVRRFIETWAEPVRVTIREIEASIESAQQALSDGNTEEASIELDSIRQMVGEGVRADLGIYSWDDPTGPGSD